MREKLKKMRRERDEHRDKHEYLTETVDELKRQRDQYRRKLERGNVDVDDVRLERTRSERSSANRLDRRPVGYSKTSSGNMRAREWTRDDERAVRNFREKHAATVIQRGWRHHRKSHRGRSTQTARQSNFDMVSGRFSLVSL